MSIFFILLNIKRLKLATVKGHSRIIVIIKKKLDTLTIKNEINNQRNTGNVTKEIKRKTIIIAPILAK